MAERQYERCDDCDRRYQLPRYKATGRSSCARCMGYSQRDLFQLKQRADADAKFPKPPQIFFLNEQHEI